MRFMVATRLVDVLVRPLGSLRVVLDGGVLGRQAKGIEADGMQHVVAAHAGLTGHGIADGIVARVAHVEVARGIREHLEHVLLGLAVVGVDGKEVRPPQAFIHLDSMACAS